MPKTDLHKELIKLKSKSNLNINLDFDPNKIECHFGLLKRTAKRNEVEIFKVTSGKRRTENAMKLLVHALHNIDNGVYIKNRTSCAMCEFKGTVHCP